MGRKSRVAAPQISLQFTTLPADRLTIPAWNPQIHDEVNLNDIKRSIKEFGYVDPILVRLSDGLVIGGAGRLLALRELWAEGWQGVDPQAVPVIGIECDDRTAKKISLALNRIQSQPDLFLLSQLLSSLVAEGETIETLTVTGYRPAELTDLLQVTKDITNHFPELLERPEIAFEPEKPEAEPESKETLVIERRFKVPFALSSLIDDALNRIGKLDKKASRDLGLRLAVMAQIALSVDNESLNAAIQSVMDIVGENP